MQNTSSHLITIFQNVLFYLISDDYGSASKYLFREENDKFNIVLPYNGTNQKAGMCIKHISEYVDRGK